MASLRGRRPRRFDENLPDFPLHGAMMSPSPPFQRLHRLVGQIAYMNAGHDTIMTPC